MESRDHIYRQIAAELGTPAYVYDLDLISSRLNALKSALPDASVRFAVKANPQGEVLRLLASAGAGAEAITVGELTRALAAGIRPDSIIVGGPAQPRQLRELVLSSGAGLVSLDSSSQWVDWQESLDGAARSPGFLVRVNPALDPRTHRHLATGSADSKFGVLPEEAGQLAQQVAAAGLFRGFHVHAGSQIGDLGVFRGVLAVLEPLFDRFGGEVLDIGGGYRVPDFPLDGYAELVGSFAAARQLQLIIEPGRWLTAEAGVLLTTVLHVKKGAVNHVIADAGMADLIRPALYDADHPVRLLGAGQERQLLTVDLDGPLCENADRLAQGISLPEPAKGDLLAVGLAGAYGFGMASNYASNLRAAEAVVSGDSWRSARRREEPADLLRPESG